VARYDRLPESDAAEVAFVVADEFQGRGVGGLLLRNLAAIARARGIARFVADTLSDNRRMLRTFQRSGFPTTRSRADGVERVTLDIAAVAGGDPLP
jgi:GNAT superfamily N-acetyltransferase